MDMDAVINGLAHELWAMSQGVQSIEDATTPIMDELTSFAGAAIAAERERCAAYCGELAKIMECGAGELGPGQRLRQAEQTIRAGRHWTPNV